MVAPGHNVAGSPVAIKGASSPNPNRRENGRGTVLDKQSEITKPLDHAVATAHSAVGASLRRPWLRPRLKDRCPYPAGGGAERLELTGDEVTRRERDDERQHPTGPGSGPDPRCPEEAGARGPRRTPAARRGGVERTGPARLPAGRPRPRAGGGDARGPG